MPVQLLFSQMASVWVGSWWEKASLGCILEAMRFNMLILGCDIGWGMRVCNIMVLP